jgi:hypothetical protein
MELQVQLLVDILQVVEVVEEMMVVEAEVVV